MKPFHYWSTNGAQRESMLIADLTQGLWRVEGEREGTQRVSLTSSLHVRNESFRIWTLYLESLASIPKYSFIFDCLSPFEQLIMPSTQKTARPIQDEGATSSTESEASIPEPQAANKSLSTIRACLSTIGIQDHDYEADDEESGEEEDCGYNESVTLAEQDDDTASIHTVSTEPATLEERFETPPSQQQHRHLQQSLETPSDRLLSSHADSELDIEDLLLDLCEPRGFCWNSSDGGILWRYITYSRAMEIMGYLS